MDELKHIAAALPFLIGQITEGGVKVTLNTKRIWEAVITAAISSVIAGGLAIWTLTGRLDERVSALDRAVYEMRTDIREIRNFVLTQKDRR